MRYQGSKFKLGKSIVRAIVDNLGIDKTTNRPWVEPFCGALGMSVHASRHFNGVMILNDLNSGLIEMWSWLQKGWTPPSSVTKEMYLEIKGANEFTSSALVEFVAHGCSYGGKRWGGYASGGARNYADEAKKSCILRSNKCKNALFHSIDYGLLEIPPWSVIYCDPPYQDTLGYGQDFDHLRFWKWCVSMKKMGHDVYVSEYQCPEWVDAECIWEQNRTSTMDKKELVVQEKLFRINRG